jgi:hypothetical protein
VSFFDSPPPEPPAPASRRYRAPEWGGPLENVLPGIAPLELLLVNSGRMAVWIAEAEAYPNGAVLKVWLRGRQPAQPGAESGPGTWRFGVQFSDGHKATVYGLGIFARLGRGQAASSVTAVPGNPQDGPPESPLLVARGGGGSRDNWRQEYWLWPLPPPGDLLIACEWPDLDLSLTTVTVSADPIRDAAGRAQQLWPPDDLPDWPGNKERPTPSPG